MWQGTTKHKDAMSPKPAKVGEAARSGGSESSGQWRSSQQATAQPPIIDMVVSVDELEEPGPISDGKVQFRTEVQTLNAPN